ncbi:MAG: hypothetical protein ABSB91_06615 [Sedimentisphaerales bacterium]|jgi:hypothetical protein
MILTTNDLISIVSAGGGIVLDTKNRTTQELISIAAASRNKGSKVILTNLSFKTTMDLVSIGAAGNGNVIFMIDNKIPEL